MNIFFGRGINICCIVVFAITSLLMTLSCNKEKSQTIPDDFAPYVESFFEDAQNRGRDISLTDFDLNITFSELDEYSGICNLKQHLIEIDENRWQSYDSIQREWIIFHELGHCILERAHKNDKSNNGECLSIMHEKFNGFDCSSNFYFPGWRDYYVDELFNENTNLPNWHANNQSYHIDENGRNYFVDTAMTSKGFTFDVEFDIENNFVIELEFYDWVQHTNSINLRWDNNFFSYCEPCALNKLNIHFNDKKVFYDNSIEGEINTKLTIIKEDNQYRFFFNEQFVHTFEFVGSSDFNFGTIIPFDDEPINMEIKAYTFD